jgi:hypothetical protein
MDLWMNGFLFAALVAAFTRHKSSIYSHENKRWTIIYLRRNLKFVKQDRLHEYPCIIC